MSSLSPELIAAPSLALQKCSTQYLMSTETYCNRGKSDVAVPSKYLHSTFYMMSNLRSEGDVF